MTTQLKNFFFHDGSVEAKSVRVLEQQGEPWFAAMDVCDALGLTNTSMALRSISESRKHQFNLGMV